MFEIWLILSIIALAAVVLSSLWNWINDKKYESLIFKIGTYFKLIKLGEKDIDDISDELLIIGVLCVILLVYFWLWKLTVPVSLLIGGIYYARYYIRQKRKSLEKETE